MASLHSCVERPVQRPECAVRHSQSKSITVHLWTISNTSVGSNRRAATVCCGALIKLTLDFEVSDHSSPYAYGLVLLINAFFISLIVYGAFCAWYITRVTQGIISLVPLDLVQRSQVVRIANPISWFYWFPTTTFIFMWVGWLWLVKTKWREK